MFSMFEDSACSRLYGYSTDRRRGCKIAAFENESARAGAGFPSAIHAPAAAGLTILPGTRIVPMPSMFNFNPRLMTSAAALMLVMLWIRS